MYQLIWVILNHYLNKLSLMEELLLKLLNILNIQQLFSMFSSCRDASNILMSSYQETALMSGVSDIVVVEWSKNKYKSSPFLVCFGSMSHRAKQEKIQVYVNNKSIEDVNFIVNKYGYLQPLHPSSQTILKFQLLHGRNQIIFKTKSVSLEAQIYQYNLNDKIVISDMDGTMTKSDLMGIVSNFRQTHYIHEGYETFINQLIKNGYKVIWVTMRSISLYKFSKKYIKKYIGCEGALIPEPEQFLPSLKKQLMRKTSQIKTNMMNSIRKLYPSNVNPLVGGLGNRQNDAIAYLALGIPMDRIYIVTGKSEIVTMKEVVLKNYSQLQKQIQQHFPKICCIEDKKQHLQEIKNINKAEDLKQPEKKKKKSLKQYFNGLNFLKAQKSQ